MGVDIHGINPVMREISEDKYPTYHKYHKLNWGDRIELFRADSKLEEKYNEEWNLREEENCGIYFRNNCWWWRPLWDYCFVVAPDIISDELWNLGHGNNGAGLDDEGAKALGNVLMEHIANGHTILYQEDFEKDEKDYTFDVDNVEAFAKFCLECGGFEIQ